MFGKPFFECHIGPTTLDLLERMALFLELRGELDEQFARLHPLTLKDVDNIVMEYVRLTGQVFDDVRLSLLRDIVATYGWHRLSLERECRL